MNKDQIKLRRKEYSENINHKNWRRIYDIDYRERNGEKIQLYKKNYFQNKKKELYEKIKKRKDEDVTFRLACNLQKTILNAFKARIIRKTNKTFYLLGCSHSFLRLWIESQLYGEMTLEKYGKFWCLDHCLPIASFNLLDENDVKKCFNWVKLRPMYVKDNISKGDKIDYHLNLLQEVKAKNFTKLNAQEGLI